MADPLWLADVLRAEGLDVAEYPGWKDRGHGDFGAIWGVVAHHTGNNPPSDNPGYIANHPSLGLCSQLHLNRNGRFTVVGAGIAWHAGEGSYPGIARDNANQVTIGIEAENNGTEGWSPAQYSAYVRGVAAILRKLGYNSSHVIGHKEWAGAAQGKWDPGGMDMAKFRRDVQAQIDKKGGDAPMSAAEVKQVQDFVAGFCGPIGSDVKDIRQQVTGGRDAGEYPGWPQLGGRTLVDAVAAIGEALKLPGFKAPKAGALMTEPQRKAIYVASTAVLGLLAAYNVIDPGQVEPIVGFIGSALPMLATILAWRNTGTGKHAKRE